MMGDPSGYIFFSDTRRWDKTDGAATPAPADAPPTPSCDADGCSAGTTPAICFGHLYGVQQL